MGCVESTSASKNYNSLRQRGIFKRENGQNVLISGIWIRKFKSGVTLTYNGRFENYHFRDGNPYPTPKKFSGTITTSADAKRHYKEGQLIFKGELNAYYIFWIWEWPNGIEMTGSFYRFGNWYHGKNVPFEMNVKSFKKVPYMIISKDLEKKNIIKQDLFNKKEHGTLLFYGFIGENTVFVTCPKTDESESKSNLKVVYVNNKPIIQLDQNWNIYDEEKVDDVMKAYAALAKENEGNFLFRFTSQEFQVFMRQFFDERKRKNIVDIQQIEGEGGD